MYSPPFIYSFNRFFTSVWTRGCFIITVVPVYLQFVRFQLPPVNPGLRIDEYSMRRYSERERSYHITSVTVCCYNLSF